MQDPIQIRPAQPADAEVAAILLSSAYTHTQFPSPLLDEHASGWTEHLARFFRQDGTRFSYQNVLVAELNAEVVGLVLSFGGRDETRLNAAIGGWLEHESEDDEWYVDAIAVFGNWGNRGIGTSLLEHIEQVAHQHHYSKVGLHVAEENTRALHLYTRLHYVVVRHTFLYQRPYVRMVKTLEENNA